MNPIDREVLTLRHCEQLSNDETATVLNISRSDASEAYIRAPQADLFDPGLVAPIHEGKELGLVPFPDSATNPDSPIASDLPC